MISKCIPPIKFGSDGKILIIDKDTIESHEKSKEEVRGEGWEKLKKLFKWIIEMPIMR